MEFLLLAMLFLHPVIFVACQGLPYVETYMESVLNVAEGSLTLLIYDEANIAAVDIKKRAEMFKRHRKMVTHSRFYTNKVWNTRTGNFLIPSVVVETETKGYVEESRCLLYFNTGKPRFLNYQTLYQNLALTRQLFSLTPGVMECFKTQIIRIERPIYFLSYIQMLYSFNQSELSKRKGLQKAWKLIVKNGMDNESGAGLQDAAKELSENLIVAVHGIRTSQKIESVYLLSLTLDPSVDPTTYTFTQFGPLNEGGLKSKHAFFKLSGDNCEAVKDAYRSLSTECTECQPLNVCIQYMQDGKEKVLLSVLSDDDEVHSCEKGAQYYWKLGAGHAMYIDLGKDY
eukprot:GHVS01010139.1.p1 GENE.GHVS01010139.1~~GHVS01010139.1.p1  ORF type:complete len:342 (+),score=12.54 GHVS01010139.1:108-1133(+)